MLNHSENKNESSHPAPSSLLTSEDNEAKDQHGGEEELIESLDER